MAAQSLLRIMYIMLNIFDQLYCIMPVAAKVPSMSNDRLQQRAQQFAKAVARLEDACDQPENEFIRDSVIQRFEFCFELSWKMLKLKLNTEGIDASTPRTVIRKSVTAGLLMVRDAAKKKRNQPHIRRPAGKGCVHIRLSYRTAPVPAASGW